ncbi:MAG: hypothetical protein M1831_002756 [Alyxoria varia]|nr:MAG: hypothetical protein M1831_002756 [Alyxoria varia]
MARLSNEAAEVIAQALARGLSRTQISNVAGVSDRAVSRVKANLKKYGTPQAPNMGIKIGRPIMMSEEQAEALMAWMRLRNYSFYIKDALNYLTTEHGYKGVHGTVRRFLIRSGFKRKMPAPKAEISVWLPPDTLPPMKSVLDGTYNGAAENGDFDSDSDDNDDTIDPELEDSNYAQTPTTDAPLSAEQPSNQQPSTSYAAPPPPPPRIQMPSQPVPTFQTLPQPQPQEQQTPVPNVTSTPTPASSAKRGRKRKKTGSTGEEDEIAALRNEVVRQTAIIQDLQRQLAHAQAQVQAQSGPSQTSVTDINSAHLLAQLQQHG